MGNKTVTLWMAWDQDGGYIPSIWARSQELCKKLMDERLLVRDTAHAVEVTITPAVREGDRIRELETALTACVEAMRKVRPCEECNRTPWLGICMCVECGHYRSLKSALSAAAPLIGKEGA